MIKKILMPLDGSHLGESILPYAAQMAVGLKAEITMLHVTSVQTGATAAAMIDTGHGGAPISAKQYLEVVQTRLGKQGVATTGLLTAGEPTIEIIDESDRDYDLIAMATHGRSGVGRWVLGSTADKVLHEAERPLLLIRPQSGRPVTAKPIDTLVVPLDGSPVAEAVLPTVIDLAAQMDLPVVLVQVVPLMAQMYGGFETYSYDPRLDQDLEAAAVKYMKVATERLTSLGVRATYEVLRGHPADRILESAEKTSNGMIVMATHGRSGIGRWVLGSIADRVVRASSQPVLLLRAEAV